MAVRHWLLLAIVIGVLCGCSIAGLSPTVVAPPTIASRPSATPMPTDTGWQLISPGIEYRELRVTLDDRSDRLRLARIDPAQTRLRVLYDPDRPRRVSEWLSASNAIVAADREHAAETFIHDAIAPLSVCNHQAQRVVLRIEKIAINSDKRVSGR